MRHQSSRASSSEVLTLRALAFSTIGGVLYFVSFLRFELFVLAWVCFVPVLLAVRNTTTRQALLLGTLFGFVTNAGGFYWIVHLITEFGGVHIALAVLGFVLLCMYQGLLLGLAVALVRFLDRRLRIAPVWTLPAAMAALEFVYPLLFPSFVGNSQYMFSAITQIVDVTGMLGLTVLIGLVNGAAYELFDSRFHARRLSPLRLAVPLGVFAISVLYGSIRLPAVGAEMRSAETIKVALIQTNVGSKAKARDADEFFRQHVEMSKQIVAANPDVELVVWPESVYPNFILKSRKVLSDPPLDGIGRPIIFGAITVDDRDHDGDAEVYNSIVLTSREGEVLSAFDKVKLLAFGETVPFSDVFPVFDRLLGPAGGFTRGDTFQNLRTADLSLLPTVCYEDIIPSLPRKIWREDGPANLLVNVTNDSWYGDTHEPMLHLVLASFRSIETRRAMIRSTNTGISAMIAPTGRIERRTGQWTREVLVADAPVIRRGSSTLYMRMGDWVGWASLTLIAILVSAAEMKRRRVSEDVRVRLDRE